VEFGVCVSESDIAVRLRVTPTLTAVALALAIEHPKVQRDEKTVEALTLLGWTCPRRAATRRRL